MNLLRRVLKRNHGVYLLRDRMLRTETYRSYDSTPQHLRPIEETLYCTADIIKGSSQYNNNNHNNMHRLSEDFVKYDSPITSHNDSVIDDDEGRLTEEEVEQIEHCYRSQKTFVYVARCLANLYFSRTDTQGQPIQWELSNCGVPVLILDKGETRARSNRQLSIVLAEKGTGFALWSDKIDNLSAYTCPGDEHNFQTMYLSFDHREMIGLSFDLEDAAQDFFENVSDLTSDPKNISLSMPKLHKKKSKKNKSKKETPEKKKKINKAEISSPVCFQHVTGIGLIDKDKLHSLTTLVKNLNMDVSSEESASTSGISSNNSITSSHL